MGETNMSAGQQKELMAQQSVGVMRNLAKSENHITHDLDVEIKKTSNLPQSRWQRFRVKGQHVLHGKYVLILVVALCILDCCLVITELILDIHAVKDALSTIQHNNDYLGSDYDSSHSNSSYDTTDTYPVSDRAPDTAHSVHRRASANGHDIPLTMEIAHGCHFASVAILGVLLVYVIFKVVFFGKEMFSKKLEMFDAFVVLASFALDLAFLDGVTNGPIENTAFILSFFVPWRVLRVVNSLVVAILDREHYKLVVIYKSKKRVELNLDEVRDELHEALNRVKKLKELALKDGVEEWKVNLCLVQASKNDGKKNALSSFASFTFGAMTDRTSSSKKRSNGVAAKKPIRIPQLLEEEEPRKTKLDDKEVTSSESKTNDTTTTDTPETGHPKSLSGDSALSLSLDAEQNDVSSGTVEAFQNPDVEQATPNMTELAQQTTCNNLEKENEIGPSKTEQRQHVTVVNIPEHPDQSDKNKQDHTAIQISFPASNSEKTPVKDKFNSGDTEQSGHDNPTFVADDCNTKL